MAKRTEEQLVQDIAIPGLIQQYKKIIKKRMDGVTAKDELYESSTWSQLIAEARAFDEKPGTANVKMLAAAARVNNTPLPQFVSSLLNESEAINDRIGELLGQQKKGIEQIKASVTLDDIEAVKRDLNL